MKEKQTHKLTEKEAMEIYKQYHEGVPPNLIAAEYQIHRTMVYSIGKKETWRAMHKQKSA